MKVRESVFGVLIAVILVCAVSACSEQPRLSYNLKKGESHKIEFIAEQKISQEMMGMKQDVEQTIGIVYTCNVTEVEDKGTMTIKYTYDSVSYKLNTPMEKIEYDSKNPPEEIHDQAKGFAALPGLSFTTKMTPNGTITEVQGAQALIDSILEKLELPEGAQKRALEKSLKQNFSDEALTHQLQITLATYPDKPAVVGDSWKRTTSGVAPLACIMDTTFTLKSLEGGVALIEVDTKIKPDKEAKATGIGAMKIKAELSGTAKGSMEVDVESGWPRSAKLTQDISGTLKIEGMPMPEGGEEMSFPITVKSTITVKSVKK